MKEMKLRHAMPICPGIGDGDAVKERAHGHVHFLGPFHRPLPILVAEY